MTVTRVARFVGVAVTGAVLVVSGAYVLIDLARWEWQRALSSAIFFLAALVVAATSLVLRAIHRLEDRLTRGDISLPSRSTAEPETDAGSSLGPARNFDWLRKPPEGFGVFIPVLLGAGVVLSAVAYVVERIAAAVSGPTLDSRTAERLGADLTLGSGPLREVTPSPDVAPPEPGERSRRRVVGAVAAVVAVIAVVASIQVLRNFTQTRPGEVASPGTTSLVVSVEQQRNIRLPEAVVSDLWGSCRSLVPGTHEIVSMVRLDTETVRIEVDVALGRTGRARIVGCFQDHTIDLVRADVGTVVVSPAATVDDGS